MEVQVAPKPFTFDETAFHLLQNKQVSPSGCWLWTGGMSPDTGYGACGRHGECYVHRVAYIVFIGPIPMGKQVLHSCDVKICINPAHFFLGNHQANMADKVAKGRQAREFMLPQTIHSDEKVAQAYQRRLAGATYKELSIFLNMPNLGATWNTVNRRGKLAYERFIAQGRDFSSAQSRAPVPSLEELLARLD